MEKQYIICTREGKRCGFIALLPLFFMFIIPLLIVGCKQTDTELKPLEEDSKSKKMMQGIWIYEDEDAVAFRVKGDTIYYPDSVSQPVHFFVVSDSLVFDSSHPSKYALKLVTDKSLRFINADGDEIRLQKSDDKSYLALFEKQASTISVNQGELIKRDTVLTVGDVRYHAYVQVNPTSYKVYRQSLNENGVNVDNAYYDNIIHLALYENSTAIINRDYRKQDFASLVPKEFVEQCVFSDIEVDKVSEDGVCFIAILTIPDTYTCYNVKIFIPRKGAVKLSL